MAEEGFDDTKETSDPDEDYGLPKIEIKPIQKAESKQEEKPVAAPVEIEAEARSKATSQDQKDAKPPAADGRRRSPMR